MKQQEQTRAARSRRVKKRGLKDSCPSDHDLRFPTQCIVRCTLRSRRRLGCTMREVPPPLNPIVSARKALVERRGKVSIKLNISLNSTSATEGDDL
jgi:hypothetical protein